MVELDKAVWCQAKSPRRLLWVRVRPPPTPDYAINCQWPRLGVVDIYIYHFPGTLHGEQLQIVVPATSTYPSKTAEHFTEPQPSPPRKSDIGSPSASPPLHIEAPPVILTTGAHPFPPYPWARDIPAPLPAFPPTKNHAVGSESSRAPFVALPALGGKGWVLVAHTHHFRVDHGWCELALVAKRGAERSSCYRPWWRRRA